MTFGMPQFWRHTVTVERFEGSGAYGETFADPTDHLAWIDDERKLVRDADGAEVVSETRVFLPLDTDSVPVGSRVTLPDSYDGRTSTVLAVSRHDSAGLGSLDHIELSLK